jgi:hypothetical protein
MANEKIIVLKTQYRYFVQFWVVGSEEPTSSRSIDAPTAEYALRMAPRGAECYAFSRVPIEIRVLVSPSGEQEKVSHVLASEKIDGCVFIDGKTFDARGLRKFPERKYLSLLMSSNGTDRLVQTRFGSFQPFRPSDSIVYT